MTFLIILTILNTLAIIYLILAVKSIYYIDISKEQTFSAHTLLGYQVTLWKKTSEYSASGIYSIYIPIRNRRKIELREEILRLMNPKNPNTRYTLNAMFSWLKTWEEVRQFEKDYSVVDSAFVQHLVSKFVPKAEKINTK